jgi:hypothetical protein
VVVLAGETGAVTPGDEHVAGVRLAEEGHGVEPQDADAVVPEDVTALSVFGDRHLAEGGVGHARRTLACRLVGRTPERRCRIVDTADPPPTVHVLAVADACAPVSHRRGGNGLFVEERERRDAGLVLADPGVVEDHAPNPGLQREVAGVRPAVAAGDDDVAAVSVAVDARDGIENGRHGDTDATVK